MWLQEGFLGREIDEQYPIYTNAMLSLISSPKGNRVTPLLQEQSCAASTLPFKVMKSMFIRVHVNRHMKI